MKAPWWFPFGTVEEIAPRELNARLHSGSNLQLLDVRSSAEFREGHIPGAAHVSIQDLPGKLNSLNLDPDRPVVAICLTAHRSIPAYRLLKRAGFKSVYSLAGGMLAWRREQLPTTRAGE